MTPEILVVDDEALIRRTLLQIIREHGYEATAVGSGEEALTYLANTPTRLVLADVRMPSLGGFDLLKRIRADHPQAMVVLITGHGSVEMAVEAMQLGARDFLMKPFGMARVGEILDRLLGGPASSATRSAGSLAGMVSQDPGVRGLLETVARIAQSAAPVLIQGESGTGKELLAREIHLRSPRRDRPFLAINCAALPESLLESELFGHERGAFTGAIARRLGKFEAANQGTLLLDEVSETSLQFQAKLLRTLQEGELERVGRDRPVRVDVRVVATTNRTLREEMQAGRFRQDLFFRLNVVVLSLPPLRERPADIPLLAQHFVEKHRSASGAIAEGISPAGMAVLAAYGWPGNVRELESCIQRALLLSSERWLEPAHLTVDSGIETPSVATGTRSEMERRLILSTLERVGGNRSRAAEALGLSVRTIRNRLRQYREDGIAQAAVPAA